MYKDYKDDKSTAWVSKETVRFIDASVWNDVKLIKESYGINWIEINNQEKLQRIQSLETFIHQRFLDMTTNKSHFQKEKNLCDKIWDSNTQISYWDVNIVVPLEKIMVETLESELGDRDIIYKIDPVWTLTDINRIKPNQIVLDYFYGEDNTSKKAIEFRKNFLKYWFAVWFEWITAKKIKIKGWNEKFDWNFLKWSTEKVETKVKFELWSRIVNVDNFYIDNWVNKFDDAIDCIEVEELSKYEILSRFTWDEYFWIDDVIASLTDISNKVLHYYNKNEDIYWIMINNHLIYEGANPFPHKQLPYFVSVLDISDKHAYGEGWVITKLRFAKPYINDLLNITLKQVKNSNTPPILMGEWVDFIKEQPKYGVWKMWKFSGDMNQLKEMKVSSPDGSMFNVIEILTNMTTQMIGIDPRQLYSNERLTRFQVWIIEQNKNKRLWIYGKQIDYWFAIMLNLRLKNIHYYIDIITIEEIVDPNLKGKQKPKKKNILLKDRNAVKRVWSDWKEFTDYEILPGAYTEFEMDGEAIRWTFVIKVITESTRPILKELAKEDIKLVIELLNTMSVFAPEALQKINKDELTKMLFNNYNISLTNLIPDTQSKRIEDEVNKELEDLAKMSEIMNTVSQEVTNELWWQIQQTQEQPMI